MQHRIPTKCGFLVRLAHALLPALLLASSYNVTAAAGDDGHIQAVKQAQKSAYVVFSAGSQCVPLREDFQGWPGASLLECTYKQGSLEGIAYLLDVKAGTISSWIEGACDERLPGTGRCFATVLKCARNNSGMMFAVSGNIIEDGRNYFFRNGMTVSFNEAANGTTSAIPLSLQKALLVAPNTHISGTKTGLTRFWRTLPSQFAAAYPDAQAPRVVGTQAQRLAWLALVQAEILAAERTGKNRLLSSWLLAHRKTVALGNCPGDDDP
ncbi:hypothetical protein GFPCMMHI_01113 [Ensifer adhaerens]|nr:hypothetical protein [Ensifer adhaerens]